MTGSFDTNSVPVCRNPLQRRPRSALVEAICADLADLVITREARCDPIDARVKNRLMRHQHKSAGAVRRSSALPVLRPPLFAQRGLDRLVDLETERVVAVNRTTDTLLERCVSDVSALPLVAHCLGRMTESRA